MAKIAIDYTPAYEQGGGIGRLVRDLIDEFQSLSSKHQYKLFVSGFTTSKPLESIPTNYSWKTTRIAPKWLARIWQRAQLPLPAEYFVGAIDLYHATDFVLPPLRRGTRSIVTVHDLSFVRVPDAASPRLKAYLDVVVPRSVKRADYVTADSQATKDDLQNIYGIPGEKIEVLYSGVHQRYFQNIQSVASSVTMRSQYAIPDRPYIFTIGTVQPRKNYSRLIRAIKQLREQHYDIGLVIAGGKGWLEDEMYQTIEQTKMQDFVHLIGFADEDDLPALYHHAECVAFPSLYEGFGFPVLEAMASGTPVVTSNISSLPEVAGNAALLVDPLKVDEIAAAIQQILDDSDLRQQLIKFGNKQARKFTWAQSAKQLLQIYEKVLAQN